MKGCQHPKGSAFEGMNVPLRSAALFASKAHAVDV